MSRSPDISIPLFSVSERALDMLRRVEFGDVLLLFYLAVFLRPWFWSLNNSLAWCLTIPIAIACWYWYFATKPANIERPQIAFWLIVALPLVFAYAIRAP